MCYLFSYGCNNQSTLQQRFGDTSIGLGVPAYLENYTRIFFGDSIRWHGAVATVYPKKGSRIYGSVFQVTPDQLSILDSFESGYHRKRKYVACMDGKRVLAWVYIKDNPFYANKLPSREYLAEILKTVYPTSNGMRYFPIDVVTDRNEHMRIGFYDLRTGTFASSQQKYML